VTCSRAVLGPVRSPRSRRRRADHADESRARISRARVSLDAAQPPWNRSGGRTSSGRLGLRARPLAGSDPGPIRRSGWRIERDPARHACRDRRRAGRDVPLIAGECRVGCARGRPCIRRGASTASEQQAWPGCVNTRSQRLRPDAGCRLRGETLMMSDILLVPARRTPPRRASRAVGTASPRCIDGRSLHAVGRPAADRMRCADLAFTRPSDSTST